LATLEDEDSLPEFPLVSGWLSIHYYWKIIYDVLDILHQLEVALLNKIHQREPSTYVILGNANHQTQIALDKAPCGLYCSILVTILYLPTQ
jgi:hypothetical protein